MLTVSSMGNQWAQGWHPPSGAVGNATLPGTTSEPTALSWTTLSPDDALLAPLTEPAGRLPAWRMTPRGDLAQHPCFWKFNMRNDIVHCLLMWASVTDEMLCGGDYHARIQTDICQGSELYDTKWCHVLLFTAWSCSDYKTNQKCNSFPSIKLWHASIK